MHTVESPNPFPARMGYTIVVEEGREPYEFEVQPSPPNPPGVTVSVKGNRAEVTVPADTPTRAEVTILVSDSSDPPDSVMSVNVVA